MPATALTAIIDACVLCGPLKRNLVLALAEEQLIRVMWSEEILSETQRTIDKILVRRGLDAADKRAARTVGLISAAFPAAIVSHYAHLDDAVGNIPDDGDRHVIAAALKAKADVIVTENLRDFPRKALSKHALQARASDEFLAEVIDGDPVSACAAIERLRQRFGRDDLTPERFLDALERSQLKWSSRLLRDSGFCAVPQTG